MRCKIYRLCLVLSKWPFCKSWIILVSWKSQRTIITKYGYGEGVVSEIKVKKVCSTNSNRWRCVCYPHYFGKRNLYESLGFQLPKYKLHVRMYSIFRQHFININCTCNQASNQSPSPEHWTTFVCGVEKTFTSCVSWNARSFSNIGISNLELKCIW